MGDRCLQCLTIRQCDASICYSNEPLAVVSKKKNITSRTTSRHMREWIDSLASFTDTLPYHLNRVGVKMSEMFSAQLQAFGISLLMFRALMALHERENQRLGELAGINSIEISTMSRLVGTMSRKGLVTRDRSRDNGRTVTINLTPKGRALIREIIPIAKAYEDIVTNCLNADDVAQIKRHLSAIHASLEQFEAKGAVLVVAQDVQSNTKIVAMQQSGCTSFAAPASVPHHAEHASALSDAGD